MTQRQSHIQLEVRIGVLWPGDPSVQTRPTPETCRLYHVIDALGRCGASPEPIVYSDAAVDQVREQLLRLDGVLVWVNPIEKERDRSVLDALLRQVAEVGVFVSAHPDVILKMGTKEVLYRTRDLGWGSDTHLYATANEIREQLPARLAQGPRVLKQHRGNGGNGVWRVELARQGSALGPHVLVRVRHALRGAIEEEMTFDDFLNRCDGYFVGSGRVIDQPYQARLTEGMIRCYLVQDNVVGFGHQAINALYPAPPGAKPAEAPQPGPRLYHPPTKPEFQALKEILETEWVPAMQRLLDIDTTSLPIIWDADFFYGPQTDAGADTYVLGEINVSSVYPFPQEALIPLAQAAAARVRSAKLVRRG